MTESPLFVQDDLSFPPAKFTEADMLDMIRQRYSFVGGNGRRYAFMPHVRSEAGFDATRTLDAMVLDLWPSTGNLLHGFEIKCSRSDWLRELKDPSKAATFVDRCDLFWLVAAGPHIVWDGELPPGWGLLVPNRSGELRAKVKAQQLPMTADRAAISRSFLACLIRSAVRDAAAHS